MYWPVYLVHASPFQKLPFEQNVWVAGTHMLVDGFTTCPPLQFGGGDMAHCCPFQEYPEVQLMKPLKGTQLIPFQKVEELQSAGPLADWVTVWLTQPVPFDRKPGAHMICPPLYMQLIPLK